MTQCDGADGDPDVNSWNAGVVQFAMKDNAHVQQTGCQPVGTVVTGAERIEHGVKLTWEDTQTEGLRTKVVGELICMEDGIGHIDRMEMEEKHKGTRDEVTELSFQFNTMAACASQTPTPAPPSYPPDVCSASCSKFT
jgi:hypothetical protein